MNQIRNRVTNKVICEGDESIEILVKKNSADLAGANLARADLAGANLARADLAGANLAGANLARADLAGANLAGANLAGANLARADLAGANLARADLAGADLARANLAGANLAGADLAGANLAGADLARADLARADLAGAKIDFWQFPSVRLLSSMNLGTLSDDLTTELFQRDMSAHPKPELFKGWAEDNGPCPYRNEERFWFFDLRKECWKPGKPKMTDVALILAICKEKKWGIRGYLKIKS